MTFEVCTYKAANMLRYCPCFSMCVFFAKGCLRGELGGVKHQKAPSGSLDFYLRIMLSL